MPRATVETTRRIARKHPQEIDRLERFSEEIRIVLAIQRMTPEDKRQLLAEAQRRFNIAA